MLPTRPTLMPTVANAPGINTLLLALVALAALSCGYSFKHQGSSALPENIRTLYIASVENPTTETWLGPRLRSLLRDELTRRGWTRWTDKDDADGLMTITIDRFTRSSAVKDESEESVKYTASVTLSATIAERESGQEVWHSGNVGWSGSYYGSGENAENDADAYATEHAIRRLADLLGEGY